MATQQQQELTPEEILKKYSEKNQPNTAQVIASIILEEKKKQKDIVVGQPAHGQHENNIKALQNMLDSINYLSDPKTLLSYQKASAEEKKQIADQIIKADKIFTENFPKKNDTIIAEIQTRITKPQPLQATLFELEIVELLRDLQTKPVDLPNILALKTRCQEMSYRFAVSTMENKTETVNGKNKVSYVQSQASQNLDAALKEAFSGKTARSNVQEIKNAQLATFLENEKNSNHGFQKAWANFSIFLSQLGAFFSTGKWPQFAPQIENNKIDSTFIAASALIYTSEINARKASDNKATQDKATFDASQYPKVSLPLITMLVNDTSKKLITEKISSKEVSITDVVITRLEEILNNGYNATNLLSAPGALISSIKNTVGHTSQNKVISNHKTFKSALLAAQNHLDNLEQENSDIKSASAAYGAMQALSYDNKTLNEQNLNFIILKDTVSSHIRNIQSPELKTRLEDDYKRAVTFYCPAKKTEARDALDTAPQKTDELTFILAKLKASNEYESAHKHGKNNALKSIDFSNLNLFSNYANLAIKTFQSALDKISDTEANSEIKVDLEKAIAFYKDALQLDLKQQSKDANLQALSACSNIAGLIKNSELRDLLSFEAIELTKKFPTPKKVSAQPSKDKSATKKARNGVENFKTNGVYLTANESSKPVASIYPPVTSNKTTETPTFRLFRPNDPS